MDSGVPPATQEGYATLAIASCPTLTTSFLYSRLQGVADQVQKKKSRKTVKSQRGYAGMSLNDLAAKKAESPAARLEARQTAINKAKQEKKASANKDGKPKVRTADTACDVRTSR